MSGSPWLSVVMPTYRGARHIVDALRSVEHELAGHDGEVEVIVVDDGSDDETLDVVATFAPRLPLVIPPSQRRGSWVAAVNDGLQLARGAWSCVLHQDDAWLSGRLDALAPAVATARRARAALVVHAVQMHADDGHAVGRWRPPFPSGFVSAERARTSLLVQNWISVPAATFRTEAVRAAPMDSTLWYTADWDLWLRLARAGGLVVADGAWAAFRLHASSQTVVGSADLADFRAQLETVLARHADATDPPATRAAARLSVETNVALAGLTHRGRRSIVPWARAAATSPVAWGRFLRHSRIGERSLSRVRADLHRR